MRNVKKRYWFTSCAWSAVCEMRLLRCNGPNRRGSGLLLWDEVAVEASAGVLMVVGVAVSSVRRDKKSGWTCSVAAATSASSSSE